MTAIEETREKIKTIRGKLNIALILTIDVEKRAEIKTKLIELEVYSDVWELKVKEEDYAQIYNSHTALADMEKDE